MAWPASTQFGKGRDAKVYGKKGGKTSPHPRYRSDDWKRGYQAGWRASERWFEERAEQALRERGHAHG